MSSHDAADAIVDLYDRHAAAWDSQRGRGLMERQWLERFAALLPPGGRVLDVGCGMAEPIATWLAARGFAVTGIDTSPAMIALCRQRLPYHTWLVADMRTLDLGERFHGLMAWGSSFHLMPDEQRRLFAIFAAHALPGAGLLFTAGPAAGEAIGQWQGEPLYHASLAPEEYATLLAAHGFDVVAYTPEDPDCGRHTLWLAQARSRPGSNTGWKA